MGRIIWASDQNEQSIAEIGLNQLKVGLHPAAIAHLGRRSFEGRLPFPRLEKHQGYLFGVSYLPSNTSNLAADFDRITFVITHDAAIATVIRHGTSRINWNQLETQLGEVDSSDSTPDGGQFLLNVLRHATSQLRADAINMEREIATETWRILGVTDLTKSISELQQTFELTPQERRIRLNQLRKLSRYFSEVSRLLPRIRRIAEENVDIIRSLVANDPLRDLQIDTIGTERELFSPTLETFLHDTLVEARMTAANLEEVEELLNQLMEIRKQLTAEEHESAGRFTGAIASIMLLPTFIVGLYGQNFVDMPEKDWKYGYIFSWGTILAVTVFQLVFFRRRRWI